MFLVIVFFKVEHYILPDSLFVAASVIIRAGSRLWLEFHCFLAGLGQSWGSAPRGNKTKG